MDLKPHPFIDCSSLQCRQEPQSFPKMLAILLGARIWLCKALGSSACDKYCLSGQTLKYSVSPLPKGKEEAIYHLHSGNALHSVSYLFFPQWMRSIHKWKKSTFFPTLSSWPCDFSAMPSWENGWIRAHMLDPKCCRLIRRKSSASTNSLCGSKFVKKKKVLFQG